MATNDNADDMATGSALQQWDRDDVESTAALLNHGDVDDYSQWMRPAVRWQNLSKQRSNRCMGVLTICCLLLLVLVVATIGFVCDRRHPTECVEPRCIEATANILRVMDLDADPCQDFYQYACGRFTKVTDIPDDKSKWSHFGKAVLHNNIVMRKLLESEGDEYKGVHSDSLYKAKMYYQTCMDESIAEEAKGQPLLQLIESLGGWSVLGDEIPAGQWEESKWNLHQRLVEAHKLRMFVLFTLDIGADNKNSSENILQFYQSGLGLNAPEFYANNNSKILDAYIQLGATAMTLLHSNGQPEAIDQEKLNEMKQNARKNMEEIVEFEKKLGELFVPKNQLSDPVAIYHKMPLQELIDMVPELDLLAYLTEFLGQEIAPSMEVVVYTPSYFKKLSQLLRDTPARLLNDYSMWFMVRPLISYLSRPFQDTVMQFKKLVQGVKTSPPLWERCISEVDTAFGFVTGALYVEEQDSGVIKEKATVLTEAIRNAFLEVLPDVFWMDHQTKAKAEEKARAVKDKIGFPDWILDPVKLDEYHDRLNISTDSSFDNIINIMKFFQEKTVNDFDTPVDKTRWSMTPTEVNAYYSTALNQMVFPSGILQAPFFNKDVSMSMNFGAIGMIMAHELTHGFDNTGRKFDQFGNLHDWWENKSALAYEERTDCMVKQYSAYQEEGLNLDGQFTLGENIADNGGLKIAYKAYKNWYKDHHHNLRLQLNMTSDQEFFLGMAQVWCSYRTPEYAKLMIFMNPHAADKYRVIGPMSNMPEFSSAFRCPSDSPMNPVEKCDVW